jgi:phage tail-like protein
MNTMFPGNTDRFFPYKNFKFIVKFDGVPVAAVSKVSALKRSTEPVVHRVGGDPSTSRLSPSTWKFEPITLERGVTHDPGFEAWANLCFSTDGDAAMSLKNFRKTLTIDLLNEQGAVALSYIVFRCWVSEYQALPELDANANAVAIQMMVLQNEGWVRDLSVPVPVES